MANVVHTQHGRRRPTSEPQEFRTCLWQKEAPGSKLGPSTSRLTGYLPREARSEWELPEIEREDTDVPIRVLRLGSPRKPNEGVRLGTVRRPPRGVPKTQFATLDYYDVWLPTLAPSPELMAIGQRSQDEQTWQRFERKFRAEMNKPEAARVLDLLAALSRQTSFSLGCYCENEERCHRSILKALLTERGVEFF